MLHDACGEDTVKHSKGVMHLATRLTDFFGDDHETRRRIILGSALHDIGKTVAPRPLLDKPGILTPHEKHIINLHSVAGEKIALAANVETEIAYIIGCHHENVDGTGYPYGLKGSAIPYEARLIAICDAYDKMTTPQTYRDRLTPSAINAIFDKGRGSQWDAEILDAFRVLIAPSLAPALTIVPNP